LNFGGQLKIPARNVLGGGRGPRGEGGRQKNKKKVLKKDDARRPQRKSLGQKNPFNPVNLGRF
jgi:hypothetical protein